MYQSIVKHYCILDNLVPLGAFGLKAFNHSWLFQVSYEFSYPVLVPIRAIQVSCKIFHRSIQIFDPCCTLLVGGFLALYCSHMFEDIPCQGVSDGKRSIRDALVDLVLRGLPTLHWPSTCLETDVVQTRVVFLNMSGGSKVTQVPTTKVYQRSWKEWASQFGMPKRVIK